METKLTTMAGTASAASAFLTSATGREVTVTVDPVAPTSAAADAVVETEGEGLSTGALIGIIVGVVAAVVIVGVLVVMQMKKAKVHDKTKQAVSA